VSRAELGNLGRVVIRPSAEVERYLQDLADLGIHGKTKSEVAKTLVQNEIERLVRERFIGLRRKGKPV